MEIYSTTLWHLQKDVALSALSKDLTDMDKDCPEVTRPGSSAAAALSFASGVRPLLTRLSLRRPGVWQETASVYRGSMILPSNSSREQSR